MSGVLAVDAHHHFWDPSRARYPWLTADLADIDRPFGLADLVPLTASAGIDRTVLVQTRSSIDETREFLATAAGSAGLIAGVVGWVDLTDRAAPEMLAALEAGAGGERLVGIRHQVHDEPDPEWLVRADVTAGLRAVGDADLAYDLLVRSRELPAALEVARAHPETRFVIDHLAKPPIREGRLEPWASLLRPFGELDNVACKLSGLITEADPIGWQVDHLRPFVDVALEVFGPGRLMFGSDWPVCLLAGSYQRVVATARELVAGLDRADRDAVLGGTALRVYRLAAAG
jgi:L-fuconolactonase